jgi:hypothetical protein
MKVNKRVERYGMQSSPIEMVERMSKAAVGGDGVPSRLRVLAIMGD